jgi:transcriptional repressor NrdR
LKCPFCGDHEDKVLESRSTLDDTAVRRRRQCLKCERRYTSYEKVEAVDLMVVKQDGRREIFNREKIISGIVRSLEKRPVSMSTVHKLVDDIESDIRSRYIEEVPTKVVGELVMEGLHGIDQVAYVRFASVYRQFEDISDFVDEVRSLPKIMSHKKGE